MPLENVLQPEALNRARARHEPVEPLRKYELPHLIPDNDSASLELVTARFPSHPRTEEIRALRTQLLMRWYAPDAGRRVLAIASPGRGDGRTYVTANLAVVCSQIGLRTLLVDADLRHPRQHQIFNVSDRKGLAATLAGAPAAEAIGPAPGFTKLFLLPAGTLPPNAQELLSRTSLAMLLDSLQHEFDLILIDTPASLDSSDAQMVTYRAGHAVLLTRRDRTRLSDMSELCSQLRDTGVNVVGTVINDF